MVVGAVVLLLVCGGVAAAVLPSGRTLPALTRAQRHYLTLATRGVTQTQRWWNRGRHWYNAVLDDHDRFKLAKLWDTNGLFEALDEIALAHPSAQNLAAVTAFADGSERYWNRDLKPTPGYAPYIGDSSPKQQTWYDDNGWIGLAFVDAYRVTGNTRYLDDAKRAFRFIAAGGWDTQAGGGMWWTNKHPWRSGEALAAAADLAARLYAATRKRAYLRAAEQYIGWADKHLLRPQGVYIPVASTPYPYLIEPRTKQPSTPTSSQTPTNFRATPTKGLAGGTKLKLKCPRGAHGCRPGTAVEFSHGPPRSANARPTMVAMPHDGEGAMLSAITTLCETTGRHSWCKAAEKLAAAEIVWLAPFTDGPQYDSVLVRGLLTLYAHDHRARWYNFAVAIAGLITKHARTAAGVYLRGWDGRPVPGATPGLLRTDAGSLDVFADLATVTPPS